MICFILLWIVTSAIAILVCYYDAKKYNYTVGHFLEECLLATFLFPITYLFLADRLMKFLNINFPKIEINTDFIIEFLNKRL